MFRIDRTFKDRLVKWTVVFAVILEIVMVIINFPNVWEIIEYCGMAAVIIFFVIISEIRGIAFGLKYGLIHYVDDAAKIEAKQLESAEDILGKQLEKLNLNENTESDKGIDNE